MNETDDKITLKLEGEHAKKGVSLAAFESFVAHFVSALRYHYRSSRAEPTRKPGRPFTQEQMATAFRLVEFKTGSGIAVLRPPLATEEPSLVSELGDVPTLAWANVAELIECAESGGTLDDAVVGELEAATKSLGPAGRFSIDYRSQGSVRKHTFRQEDIPSLRAVPVLESPREHSITGVLHAIDLEPDKVGIRTPSGIDWSCRYPQELEDTVLALVGGRVWAKGLGKLGSARAGSLELTEIHAVAEYEQTELFTAAPVPLRDLMEQQGMGRPQGLNTFADPEWHEGKESDLFLQAVFDAVE